jgi:hypothetical protein
MKLFNDTHYEDLEHLLKAAYDDRDVPEMSLCWRQDVMRAIRRLEPPNAPFNALTFVEHVAWRCTIVAGIMVIMLLGYMWYAGVSPIEDVTDWFRDDPVQLTIVHVYEDF